ncbi:MAG: prepilin-type N-terminal cleavage/methylation domain-containing protein [Elusimicrobia bacterium]|nr:prepilin-type N-terminal cleavage/methylation domain-containing protein [Elusimicrobiota bacterium]
MKEDPKRNGPEGRARPGGGPGYSLTEVMMVVAILGILAAAAAPLMVQMTNFWRTTTARNEIERDVRISLETMNRYLRQAKKNTVIIDQVPGQPPFSRITFTPEKGGSVKFYQHGSKLMMQISSATVVSSTISYRLGYLSFTYPRTYEPDIVSVAVTMQAPTYLQRKKALQLSIQKVRIMN